MTVVLLGLALVLAGLDVAARAGAQAAVARNLQASEGLPRKPDVSISGFPFLLQAVRGRYQQVDVRFREVPAGGDLRLDTVDARLAGVHLPLPAVLGAEPAEVPVDTLQVTGSATFARVEDRINAAIPGGAATVHLVDGGQGRLRVTGTYTGPGGPLTLSGLTTPSVSHGRLTLSVPKEQLTQVPQVFRDTVAGLLTQSVTLQPLPLGLEVTSVAVTPQGLTATAEAQDVILRGRSPA